LKPNALEAAYKQADILGTADSDVSLIDATGLQSLWDLLDRCHRHNIQLVLCEARSNVLGKLKPAGLIGQIGKQNVLEHIQQLGTGERD
jgi:SulP family sulfate permease